MISTIRGQVKDLNKIINWYKTELERLEQVKIVPTKHNGYRLRLIHLRKVFLEEKILELTIWRDNLIPG